MGTVWEDKALLRAGWSLMVAAAVGLLLTLSAQVGMWVGRHEPRAPMIVCEEDQPCWDCNTMGNRICGP
jgi:hypothetical protein